MTNIPPQVLKPSSLESCIRHGHKNNPLMKSLITSDNDSLSSLISFSNYDNTTVDYIIVNFEATNMTSVTGVT